MNDTTEGIQPKTVLEVGQVMAAALGKDWCRDRKEVIDYVNRFREDLYLMYPEFRLFADKFYCLEVQCFPEKCANPCSCGGKSYFGVTLPPDIDGVLAVWNDHWPMRTYSKWWEARVGKITMQNPQIANVSSTLVAEVFPTERPLRDMGPLHFIAHNEEDAGKMVVVTADTCFRKNEEFHVCLVANGIAKIEDPVRHIKSVVLPSDLMGAVSLTEEDGYELSEYGVYDTVPQFRRLKFSAECNMRRVLIQGSLQFRPVYFDTDIVEVGSRRIVETAGRMYRYGENSTDSETIAKANREEATLRRLLKGALDRKRGNSSQDPSQFVRKSLVTKACLPGYGGKRNRCRHC